MSRTPQEPGRRLDEPAGDDPAKAEPVGFRRRPTRASRVAAPLAVVRTGILGGRAGRGHRRPGRLAAAQPPEIGPGRAGCRGLLEGAGRSGFRGGARLADGRRAAGDPIGQERDARPSPGPAAKRLIRTAGRVPFAHRCRVCLRRCAGRFTPKNPLGAAAETMDVLQAAKEDAEKSGLYKKMQSGDPDDLFDAAEQFGKVFTTLAEGVLAPKRILPSYKLLVESAKPACRERPRRWRSRSLARRRTGSLCSSALPHAQGGWSVHLRAIRDHRNGRGSAGFVR